MTVQAVRRLPRILRRTLVLIGLAAVAGPALGESLDDAVMRCFSLRRSEPAAAIALAEDLLGRPDLAVENQIKAQACLGMAAGITGDSVRASDSAERIEQLLDRHPMPRDFSLRALSNAGAIFHSAGEISRAEALYLRAYAIAEAADELAAQVVTLTNIGLIHADYLGAPEEADRNYRKAIDLADAHGYEDLQLFYNHAVNLVRLDRADAARAALDRAGALARKSDNTLFVARIESERAGLMRAAGQADAARALLREAVATQQRLPDPAGEAISLSILSELQRRGGDAGAALSSAENAVRLAGSGEFREALPRAMDALIAAHVDLGQAGAALVVAERRHALEIETLRSYDREALAQLQARLQDAGSEREIERLRHESEVQALRLDRNRLLRNWLVVVALLVLSAGLAFSVMQRRLNRRLWMLSTTDMLTGLLNRRAATERIGARFAELAATPDARGVLMLIDVDHFKSINDRFGHDVGDAALAQISKRLALACRPDDVVARWGGEEFLVACSALSLQQACAIAERLRRAAADTPIEVSRQDALRLTVSIGFAPYPFFGGIDRPRPVPMTWQDATKIADRALYAVKRSGRDGWAGVWGHAGATLRGLEDILDDPERAARRGDVDVLSARPLLWHRPAAAAPTEANSGNYLTRAPGEFSAAGPKPQ